MTRVSRPTPPRIAARSIELPAAGGPILGLGDRIQVQENSGLAELSIPVPVSSARGFDPALSLTYSPTTGSGVFGRGFSLSCPSISRMTTQNIPRYDDSDVFVLGDALVPDDQAPLTVPLPPNTFAVRTFRPRRETEFRRIEQWVDVATGEAFWRVMTQDNVASVYGRTAHARIADPANPARVFEWLLDYQYDAKGNAITYEYAAENVVNVPPSIFEQNRTQTANRYLTRVCYGNTTPFDPRQGLEGVGDLAWCFEIVFDFGEYDFAPSNADPYTAAGSWRARADPFSDYSPGFERRTHRLCRHVAVFHRFEELGTSHRLTQLLELGYAEGPAVSQLVSARTVGYRHVDSAATPYWTKANPALALQYSGFDGQNWRSDDLTDSSGTPLPDFTVVTRYAVADLVGNGLAGVLYADGQSARYWQPRLMPDGSVRYSGAPVAAFPLEPMLSATTRLDDLGGNGQLSLVQSAPERQGFYPTDGAGGFSPFQPFQLTTSQLPDVEWERADLGGTGRSDLVRIAGGVVEVVPSAAEAGYGAAYQRRCAPDLPITATLPNPLELVTFGSILGGGSHRLRISNGSVECWPNLGYGIFASVVSLADAPQYARTGPPPQILLADIDSSGYASIAFVYADRAEIYQNLSGNAFSTTPIVIPIGPGGWSDAQVMMVDLFGRGTQGLLFSTYLPAPRHVFYDLTPGGRPYLLSQIDNHLGATTTIAYQSSTQYYLQDLNAGLPWITNLPTPMPLVAQVTHQDAISNTTLSTSYIYHHGCYDPVEREFRGFGMVERFDVEQTVAAAALRGRAPSDTTVAPVAPCQTKTWYHTGVLETSAPLLAQYQREFFSGDIAAAPQPPDLTTLLPQGDGTTTRQAFVALSGLAIRSEVYALDGPTPLVPFAVTQSSSSVCQVIPRGTGPYDAFRVSGRETLHYSYEQCATDPLVTHSLILEIDPYGNIEQEAHIAYTRRAAQKGAPHAADAQFVTRLTCALDSYAPVQNTTNVFLSGVPLTHQEIEVLAFAAPDLANGYYSWTLVDQQIGLALGDTQGPSAPAANLFAAISCTYLVDNTGAITPQALEVRAACVAFTDVLATTTFATAKLPVTLETFLRDIGGFTLDATTGLWWNPGATQTYQDATGFYLPSGVKDVFATYGGSRGGSVTTYTYDKYSLILTTVTTSGTLQDVASSQTTASQIDYQTLAPRQFVDANGTVSEILQDPLGNVIATTFSGTEIHDGAASAVGFTPFDFGATRAMPSSIADLIANPNAYLLGAATVSFVDPTAYERGAGPACTATVLATAYPGASPPPLEISLQYDDGFGRPAQRTRSAPAGEGITCGGSGVPIADDSGSPVMGALATRWLTSGRVIYNGKGDPFRTFEPFYIGTWSFISDAALAPVGVAQTFWYDALGRSVRVDQQRGTFLAAFFTQITYASWEQTVADENDTLLQSDYYQYFIVGQHPLPPFEREALLKAAASAGTLTTTVRDNLDNTITTIKVLRSGTTSTELPTRATYDIQGHPLTAADPRLQAAGLSNVARVFALDGTVWQTTSVDAGVSLDLRDALGEPIFTANGRGFLTLPIYDSFHRPTVVTVSGGDGSSSIQEVVQRLIYGDSLDGSGATPFPPQGANARGRIVVGYDQAGRLQVPAFTIGGQPLTNTRQIRTSYVTDADWTAPATSTWAALFATLAPALDPTLYTTTLGYDAIGRPALATDPDGNTQTMQYDSAGQLALAAFAPAGTSTAVPSTTATYNAYAQLDTLIRNTQQGVPLLQTSYGYDPSTRLLTSLTTTRSSTPPSVPVQSLTYTYEPAGSLSHVQDAQAPAPRVIASQQIVTADNDYTYDTLDRLVIGTGRAQTGLSQSDQRSGDYGPFFASSSHPNDVQAVENYTLTYTYDHGDNLTSSAYQASSSAWTQTLTIAPGSNRGAESGISPATSFDGCGNPTSLSGLPSLAWNYANRLQIATIIDRGSLATSDLEAYVYGADGGRVRQVTQRLANGTMSIVETLYLGALEITRHYQGTSIVEELHRARIHHGNECVAERLSWTVGDPPSGVSSPEIRHQLHNHLGSAVWEIGDTGLTISYEEYAPYGGTTFVAGTSLVDISNKRYRFAGKARDQATGLYYGGARYYASWLGRWINPDPAGTVDGLNLYAYVGNEPTGFVDSSGYGKHGPLPAAGKYSLRKTKARMAPPKAASKAKRSSPYSRKHFTSAINYSSLSIEVEQGKLGSDAQKWLARAKRPAIPKAVRQYLHTQAPGKNVFHQTFSTSSPTVNLTSIAVNQNHKLAQSSIRAILASFLEPGRNPAALTAPKQQAVVRFMAALHGTSAAGQAEWNSLLQAAHAGQLAKGLDRAYVSLAGGARANFKVGSSALNQMIFNAADFHLGPSGTRTPLSEEIYQSVKGLEQQTLITLQLAAAALAPAKSQATGMDLDSANAVQLGAVGNQLRKGNVSYPTEAQSRTVYPQFH